MTVIISKLFVLLNFIVSQIDIIDTRNVTHYITIISNGVYQLTFYLLVLALMLIVIDFNDSFIERSTHESYQICLSHNGFYDIILNKMLTQTRLRIGKITAKSKTNSIQQYFNVMDGQSLVDVRQNEVRGAIKILGNSKLTIY
ncbi:hypothetical protein ACO2EZ_12040 [Staphylococcus epidermidis]